MSSTGGQMYLHNRQVDNEPVVIGSHLKSGSSFKDQLNETMSHELKDQLNEIMSHGLKDANGRN